MSFFRKDVNNEPYEFAVCPKCNNTLIEKSNDLECNSCFTKFPIKEKIPIIVPDVDSHLKFIEKQMSEKKQKWYTQDQVFAYEHGPYKNHILKRIKFVKEIISDYTKNLTSPKIIDLGCGDGANLKWLSEFTNDLYGTDYNFLRLNRAQNNLSNWNFSAKLFLVNILHIPFKENFFDIVFFNHVIEHIENDFLALQNIYKMTKKGGVVIFGTPNEGAFFWQLAYKIEPKIKKSTDHVQFYTANSFCELAKKAGFKIKHVEHMGWGLPVWSLDMRIRKNQSLDNLFEFFGKHFFKKQATSLYIILEK